MDATGAARGTASVDRVRERADGDPIVPAVLLCLVRAIALTSAAGYTLGQELGRHDGPPLIDELTPAAALTVLAVLAAVTWLELGLLQTRPRAGLALTGAWSVGLVVLGIRLACTDEALWLVPTAVLALPPLASLARPAAWSAGGPWAVRLRSTAPRRAARLLLVHAAGVLLLVAVASGPVLGSVGLQWLATGAVVAAWATAVTRPDTRPVGRRRPSGRHAPAAPAAPPAGYVSLQAALVVALAVLVWATVS